VAHKFLFGRSLARSHALQLLFQAEMRDWPVRDVLEQGCLVVDPLDERSGSVSLDEYGRDHPIDEYALTIALGVEDELETFDSIIEERSADWALERMPTVDRNLMRIALFEMLRVPEVAIATAIDECVELAKAYGTEDTPAFVNGILGRVADQIEAGEIEADQAEAGEIEHA
jgi:N utilization substance protein B